jgi:Zn-dependent metalloprotease
VIFTHLRNNQANYGLVNNSAREKCNPVCFIVPEYINKHIIEKGTEDQKRKAWQTLILTEQLRGRRNVTGSLHTLFAVADKLHRTIFDAKHSESLPGNMVRSEGAKPKGGRDVTEAYDYSGDTYDFYKDIFERNSIDSRGMRLDSTVHYGEQYNNAFWNGTQMVYGDGDGQIFNRFTMCLDVIGHELTHGVTQYEAALEYQGQPGALNESLSDVFGVLVKQYKLNQTVDKADWLIGAGLFSRKVKGVALRSMKKPGTAYDDPTIGKDSQPGHMRDYVNTSSDNGGVHINSGIPNHAFYLAAMEIGGKAWEKAGKIWYITLRDRLRETSDFQEMANLTYGVAGTIFGKDSKEQKAVFKGWEGVGLSPKKLKKIIL